MEPDTLPVRVDKSHLITIGERLYAENERGVDRVSPPLFFAEVTSVLRERVYDSQIEAEEGDAAFAAFMKPNVKSVAPADLQSRAWSAAKKYNRPKAYDAQYLAVATAAGCELWTGDQRLVRAINAPWVKWLGDHGF